MWSPGFQSMYLDRCLKACLLSWSGSQQGKQEVPANLEIWIKSWAIPEPCSVSSTYTHSMTMQPNCDRFCMNLHMLCLMAVTQICWILFLELYLGCCYTQWHSATMLQTKPTTAPQWARPTPFWEVESSSKHINNWIIPAFAHQLSSKLYSSSIIQNNWKSCLAREQNTCSSNIAYQSA